MLRKEMVWLMMAGIGLGALAFAQQPAPAPLTGTITFRGGQTLSGVIKTADLGVMEGAGIGAGLPGFGNIQILVAGAKQTIPATNIAAIEANWIDKSTPEETSWEISELRVTTRDGKTIVGKPAWHFHISNVTVELPSGETKRVHAFPLGGEDFSPNNLVAKIEITGAAALPASTEAQPTAPAVAPAQPAAPAPAAEPKETPAAAAPAEPAPAPTPATPPTPSAESAAAPAAPTPSPAPAPAPAATTESAPAAPAAAPTPAPAAEPIAVSVSSALANVQPGQPLLLKIPMPGTNKVVHILLYVNIAEESAVPALAKP